jgi:hypothetical protein
MGAIYNIIRSQLFSTTLEGGVGLALHFLVKNLMVFGRLMRSMRVEGRKSRECASFEAADSPKIIFIEFIASMA